MEDNLDVDNERVQCSCGQWMYSYVDDSDDKEYYRCPGCQLAYVGKPEFDCIEFEFTDDSEVITVETGYNG